MDKKIKCISGCSSRTTLLLPISTHFLFCLVVVFSKVAWPLMNSCSVHLAAAENLEKQIHLKWQIRARGYAPNHWHVDRRRKAWHRPPHSLSTCTEAKRERDRWLTFTGFGTDECVTACRHSDRRPHGHSTCCLIAHMHTQGLPGSIGELEDDVISQVVHFPQPEVIGNVVSVHKRLWRTQSQQDQNLFYILTNSEVRHNSYGGA